MGTSSPFPGMDPFLEDPVEWGGVHTWLLTSIGEQLTRAVAPNFSVKIEQHVYLMAPEETRPRQVVPDVYAAMPLISITRVLCRNRRYVRPLLFG